MGQVMPEMRKSPLSLCERWQSLPYEAATSPHPRLGNDATISLGSVISALTTVTSGCTRFKMAGLATMFVENNDIGVALGLESSHEVLSNETGAAWQQNLDIVFHH